jgi:hypothetical protein
VTRKQFGIMLGAGVAMMLPKVANAIAVTESDVNVTMPDFCMDAFFGREDPARSFLLPSRQKFPARARSGCA